jgi:4'-phosphopantetheinyl transferase
MTIPFEAILLITSTPLASAEYDALLPLVSPEKRERIERHHRARDAHNSLLGDVLARLGICRATGLSNKQLEFAAGEYGKPFLTNHPHIHHNISHTGYYVACVLDDQPVGIDIERIKPIDLKIAERFFSSEEIEYILSSDDEKREIRFFEVWTKKESRIKWEGKGLSKPLPSFNVFSSSDTVNYHQVYCDDNRRGKRAPANRPRNHGNLPRL